MDPQTIQNDNIRTIFTILAFGFSIITFIWSIIWTIYSHRSAKKLTISDQKRQEEWETYAKENNETIRNYTEKNNDKNELLNHVTDFNMLCYDILNNSILCLEIIKISTEDSKGRKISFTKKDQLTFHQELSKLKIKIYSLRTHLTYLTVFLADKTIAFVSSQSYNELYFLVELIQDTLLEVESKKISDKQPLIEQIKKALDSADQLRVQLDLLINSFFAQISKYYPDMNLEQPTFSTGTEIFSWYYPQYPQKISGMEVEKDGVPIENFDKILEELLQSMINSHNN